MNFQPKLEIEFDPVEKNVLVKDVTGLYHATTNPEGWGAPNPERTNCTAKLIFQFNKKEITRVDVSGILHAAVGEEVDFGVYLEGAMEKDGVYRVMIHVKDEISGADFFSFFKYVFKTEEARMMASKFWAKLACIHDIYKKKDLEEECIWIEGNIQGLETLKERSKESQFLNLLGFVNRRIDVNKNLFL